MYPNPRVNEIRRQLIVACAARHMQFEEDCGTTAAVQDAISSLIGAAQFLALRLGEKRAGDIIARLHASL